MLNESLKMLSHVTQNLPLGTNLGLLHLLWALVSGALLASRGALMPALKSIGLSDAATRRAWTAFRKGQWQIRELLVVWRRVVETQPEWQVKRIEGYVPIALDITAFWRPKLKATPSVHYHPLAGRALPAVIIGLAGEVGEIGGQRLVLPRYIMRVHPHDGSEMCLWSDLLKRVGKDVKQDEIVVVDAGVKISALQTQGIQQYVVRLASNFTAQRNQLPDHKRGRKPIYGQVVRPLARTHKGNNIPATPPDEVVQWEFEGRNVRVDIWRELVLPETIPHADNKTFAVYAFHDPAFKQAWLLATSVKMRFDRVHAVYSARWAVEQIPLSAKQMLGSHRQFVHARESVQRLPELALLAGSIVSFLATLFPPCPTGFWDRQPKRTAGRFRRALFGQPFPKDALLVGQLREKRSATDHLPKGFLARAYKTVQAAASAAGVGGVFSGK